MRYKPLVGGHARMWSREVFARVAPLKGAPSKRKRSLAKGSSFLSDSLRRRFKLISFSREFAAFAEAEGSTMVPVAPVARSTSWSNST